MLMLKFMPSMSMHRVDIDFGEDDFARCMPGGLLLQYFTKLRAKQHV